MTRAARPVTPVPRYALTRQEAAESLGVSVDHFARHIQPHLKVARTGQLVLISPAELERWMRERSHFITETAV